MEHTSANTHKGMDRCSKQQSAAQRVQRRLGLKIRVEFRAVLLLLRGVDLSQGGFGVAGDSPGTQRKSFPNKRDFPPVSYRAVVGDGR